MRSCVPIKDITPSYICIAWSTQTSIKELSSHWGDKLVAYYASMINDATQVLIQSTFYLQCIELFSTRQQSCLCIILWILVREPVKLVVIHVQHDHWIRRCEKNLLLCVDGIKVFRFLGIGLKAAHIDNIDTKQPYHTTSAAPLAYRIYTTFGSHKHWSITSFKPDTELNNTKEFRRE